MAAFTRRECSRPNGGKLVSEPPVVRHCAAVALSGHSLTSPWGHRMFGFRKSKLLSKMQNLHHLAGTSVFCRYRAAGAGGHEAASMRAAALLGAMFGKSPSTELSARFDMDEIRRQAQTDFAADRALRELVVQALRVEAALAAEGKLPPLVPGSLRILESSGAEFPEAPTPASFEALVHGYIATLPGNARADVMRQFGVA